MADAVQSDGIFRGTLAVAGATRGGGFVLRYTADTDPLILAARVSSAVMSWRLLKRVAGVSTQVAAFGLSNDGDQVAVQLSGTTVTVFINGVAQTRVTITEFATATEFGLYSSTARGGASTSPTTTSA